ncbi:MAG: rod shape-determining protein MreC [Anaerolineae bacterium]|nr:rod shape-determining protein MreC [Anaerolineae bacterium]
MVRAWRANRILLLVFCLLLSLLLIGLSNAGLLGPLEEVASIPLNLLTGALNQATLTLTGGVSDLAQLQSLQQRNAALEDALADLTSELVELREIARDYERLAEMLDYAGTAANQEFVTADVISNHQSGLRRSITISRGTRDGIAVGMPVVTAQGLVGRVLEISANASRILLVTDRDSAVSARLQGTRVQGSLRGQLSGSLRLTLVPPGESIVVGDLVLTSGLGGNFPPDIIIGQVASSRQFQFELFQEAEIISFNNFDELEVVLGMTSFEPIDPGIFDEMEN